MNNKMTNLFKKPLVKYGLLVFLLIGLLLSGKALLTKESFEDEQVVESAKEVSIQKIGQDNNLKNEIRLVGTVEPENKIDVAATASGNLAGLYFSVGDTVGLNQLLGQLSNSTALTGLSNAKTNLNNTEINLESTKRTSEENLRQAAIGIEQARVGVQNAEKSIGLAELSLKSAQDNFDNASSLQEKRLLDTKNQAIINWNNYLNSLFSAEDQARQFLKIGDGDTLDSVLGAKNRETITLAVESHALVKSAYTKLNSLSPSLKSIEKDLTAMIEAFSLTEKMLADLIRLLDSSISSQSYPESLIASQKNSFSQLRAAIIQTQNGIKAESQALSSIALSNQTERSSLENAIKAAEAQLSIAKISKSNAELSLKNAEQSVSGAKEAQAQQLEGAKSQIDNARGQYNITASQTSDLSIKAPIAGIITGKYVDLGAEINPGQKIAEISQINRLKIVVSLSSEDIYRIELGQTADLGNGLSGTIWSINPAADPISKKVQVEILFDNKNKDLIPGTFIDVIIPVKELVKSTPNSFFIPLRTAIITQNEKYVFVNEGGIAKKTLVETGQVENALVEIISGLKEGDELIIEGAKNLEDGETVSLK